ncbi:MAG: ParB/RepB/Spo0J family partition protein [Actinobacteria bacterium]|nr:ParB/RepB/Spo0J family partition protein [Actinomycetota bacterium]
MAKKKNSVEESVAQFFAGDKKELSDDLFNAGTSSGLVNISLSRIVEDKNQPRKTFNSETIKELASSIKEQGIINPITVRPYGGKYVIIAGERRFLAARQAGLKVIPALVRKVSKNDVMLISLIENLQREDLNSIDRAEGIKALKVNLGLPWTQVAKKLGLSKQRILDLVGLLDLPDEIKEDIRSKKLTEKHGRALRKLKSSKDEILKVSKIVKEEKLSGDETLKLTKEVKSRFGTYRLDPGAGSFKSEIRQNTVWEVIKVCQNLLSQIKNARTGFSLDTEMTKEDKKELKEMLDAVTNQIEDFIRTYNL